MRNVTILASTAFMLFSAAAFAAGSGGSGNNGASAGGSSGNGGSSPSTHGCKQGEVWDKKSKACIKSSGSLLPDEELFQQGRALAKEGNYDWALTVLAQAKNQKDPRVLTYIGYSNRKAGRLDIGIGYYQQALAIDPNFVTAREYLGEGYMKAGKVDLAKAELSQIAQRCGLQCEEYKDLAEAIGTGN